MFINLNQKVNSHIRLVATIWDRAGLKRFSTCPFRDNPQLRQALYLTPRIAAFLLELPNAPNQLEYEGREGR